MTRDGRVLGRLIARLAGGSGSGGILTELTRADRDGATPCPVCPPGVPPAGFTSIALDRDFVRCSGCRTVFRRAPATTIGTALGMGSPAPGSRTGSGLGAPGARRGLRGRVGPLPPDDVGGDDGAPVDPGAGEPGPGSAGSPGGDGARPG